MPTYGRSNQITFLCDGLGHAVRLGEKMMPSKGETYSEQIVRYACNTSIKDLPGDVVQKAKTIILDSIGAILAASSPRYSASRVITEFVRRLGGIEESTVIGRNYKTASVHAALTNGTLGYYCDIEAHHPGAILHPAAVLLPSILAVSEKENVSGGEVITAFTIGVDLETRFSYALSPKAQYARGFHPSCVCGSLAASLAAGKILGLGEEGMLNALGLSGCQASGLLAWETDKTEMSRPFQMGIAARNGVTSALLAKEGFSGPEVLEGKYNIFNAFSGVSNYGELSKELGETYQIMALALKRYSCCAFLHPGLDALLKVMKQNQVKIEEIKRITLRFPSSGAKLIDNAALRSHNAQYILAVAALRKGVKIDDILADWHSDQRVEALSDRVEIVYDEELDQDFPQKYASIIILETSRGERFEDRVDFARGTPENPMSDKEIEEKFLDLAAAVVDGNRAGKIISVIRNLEECRGIRDLTALLSFDQ